MHVSNMFKLLVYLLVFQSTYCLNSFDNYKSEVTQILEKVVRNYDNQVSDIKNKECVSQIRLFLRNFFKPTGDDIWALRMLDASAKTPTGLLEFNLNSLGRFDECLSINSTLTEVKGKYCLLTLSVSPNDLNDNNEASLQATYRRLSEYSKHLEATNGKSTELELPFLPSFGICIPDKCTDNDVQTMASSFISLIPWNVSCQTKESVEAPLDVEAIATLSFFGFVTCIMILSTIYEILPKNDRKPYPLLLAFSVFTNGRKLMQISKNTNDFSCLNGIRCLSMIWVIYGHVFFSMLYRSSSNVIDILKYLRKTESMIISNAPFSVDTFFVVTGMLVVYSFMKTIKQKQKFNIFVFYLHRYLRLTPAIIPVMLASMYFTKYIGSGPFHPQLDQMIAQPCKDKWWTTLLYLQNYVHTSDNNCINQSWYLNIDWQLYVISPIFLLLLPKWPLISLAIMLCGVIGPMVTSYIITWKYNLIALQTNFNGNILDYNGKYYFKTHTRASTWFIGAITGYILGKMKLEQNLFHLKLPKWLIGILWLIALTAIPICIFVGHDELTTAEYHPYRNVLFNTFARPAWALCVAWVIFACSIGYGGVINSILSWQIFQVLNRFIYSMYLIHLTLLYIISYSLKEPGYFSIFNVAYNFWGAFALSFMISIYWVLAFESPILVLEKYLLGSAGQDRQQPKSQNDVESPSTNMKAEP